MAGECTITGSEEVNSVGSNSSSSSSRIVIDSTEAKTTSISQALSTSQSSSASNSFVRSDVKQEICKTVIRAKLSKQRHLVLERVIDPEYLDQLFYPKLLEWFDPQTVHYNGGIAKVTEWKISCYLEVMEGGIPTAFPNVKLLKLFETLLDECNDLFLHWYRQQHACNDKKKNGAIKSSNGSNGAGATSCRRLMTFVTRYTPQPGEQALLKHVDGAGKVDGSVVVALPIDRWSGPDLAFEGGGLTFWDGKQQGKPIETHYDTRSGDLAFIDRAVWHQADPITKGTRWALVIFYKVDYD